MSVFGERNNGEKGLYELLFSLSERQQGVSMENKLSDAGDLFDVPRGELIKLILRNKADIEGYVAENATLLKNIDDLVNAKIIADQAIAELQREEVERDVAWREEYGNLQERCKDLEIALDGKNEIVTDLMRSVETRDFHIGKLEIEIQNMGILMAKLSALLKDFSPQQKAKEMAKSLEGVLNIVNCFKEETRGRKNK